MDVVKEIIENSAVGLLSFGYKSLVLFVFALIVGTLFTMLTILLLHGSDITFHYGY